MLSIIPALAALYGLIMAILGKEAKIPLAYELGEKIGQLLKI
jgi:hypothetical protein